MSRTLKVTANHVKFARFVLLSISEAKKWLPFLFVQCIIKQLLDSVFVISRIIKVSVRVISLSRQLWLLTLIFYNPYLNQKRHPIAYSHSVILDSHNSDFEPGLVSKLDRCYVCWLVLSCHVVLPCALAKKCVFQYWPLNNVRWFTWCLVGYLFPQTAQ